MKQLRPFLPVALALAAVSVLSAADAPQPSPSQPVAAATDLATYPLLTCVVSGELLDGDMSGPVDYIHKQPGQPDRLVRFCCRSCVKEFKKDPEKFLRKIDAAAAAKAAPTVPTH